MQTAILSLLLAAGQPDGPPVVLRIYGDAKACRLEMEGRFFRLPEDDESLRAAFRAVAARSREVEVAHIDPAVPYRCAGGAIFTAQREGLVFTRVGFVSEPPPKTD